MMIPVSNLSRFHAAGVIGLVWGMTFLVGCEQAGVEPSPGGRPIPPDLLEPGPMVFATGSIQRSADPEEPSDGEPIDIQITISNDSLTVESGEAVTLRAEVDGGRPPFALVWTQLSGPKAVIGEPRGRAVTVTLIEAGVYEFAVLVVDADGRRGGDLLTMTASAGPVQLLRRLYWTNGPDQIQRIDLEETGIEDLVDGLDAPFDVALDLGHEHIYWITQQPSRIRRADLDGDNVRTVVAEPGLARGIAVDPEAEKIYWTGQSPGQVLRASLNGGGVTTIVDGAGSPEGIAIDAVNGKLYWVDRATGQILRSSLSGSGVETLVSGLTAPMRIALDLVHGRMYWTNGLPGKVQRASLSGANVRDVVTDLGEPVGIAVDGLGGKIYWASQFPGRIQRANLNGSHVETFISGLTFPAGVALEVSVAN